MESRVYLRAFEPQDYVTIVKWRNDRDVALNLGGLLLCCTREKMGGRYYLP